MSETTHYEFQAEVRQLLDILSHSLYTNRDVYIRELVSNAADALDKARFQSVKGEEMSDSDLDFEIKINLSEDDKTFTISDTGIGMTKQELIDNIGTIARSERANLSSSWQRMKKMSISLVDLVSVFILSLWPANKSRSQPKQPIQRNRPGYGQATAQDRLISPKVQKIKNAVPASKSNCERMQKSTRKNGKSRVSLKNIPTLCRFRSSSIMSK